MTVASRAPNGRAQRSIDTVRLDTEAAELRATGMTLEQIASVQGCDISTASRRVQRALDALPQEAAENLRRLEEDRLDKMWAEAWELLTVEHTAYGVSKTGEAVDLGPDHRLKIAAVHVLLRIQERRAKLRGLDAPTRKIVEVLTEDTVDAAIRQLEEELASESA